MRARWGEARGGIEVIGLGQGSGRGLSCRIEAGDGVDGRVAGFPACVVLANRDQPLVPLVEDEIGMTDVLRGSDRDRWPSGILPVDALILEVGEPHGPLVDRVRSTTVLVDPGAGVVFGRRDVRDAPVGT